MNLEKLWGGLIMLFFAGTLLGIAGTTFYFEQAQDHQTVRGPAARQERIMNRLTRDLALTPEQQAGIRPIVNRAHVEILRLRFQHQPEVEAILDKSLVDIKTTLSAEQREKLDELFAQLQERWQVSRDYLKGASDETAPPE